MNELAIILKRPWLSLSGKIRWRLLAAILIMAVAGFLTSLPPLIIGWLVDRLLLPNMPGVSTMIYPVVIIVAIIVTREILQVSRKYIVENASTRIEKRLFVDAVSHVLRIDFLHAQNSESMGALHGRIHRSVEGFVRLVKLGFLDFLPVTFAAGFSLILAFSQNLVIGTAMLLLIPIGLLIVFRQIKTQHGIRRDLNHAKETMDGKVSELLRGRDYVRAANTEALEVRNIDTIAESLREKEFKHHVSMAFYDSWKYLNEGFFGVAVLSLSLLLFTTRSITAGDVLKFSMLFASILVPLRDLHRILDEAHESSIQVRDYFGLLDKPLDPSYIAAEIAPPSSEARSSAAIIEFSGASFSYPEKKNVFDKINFVIHQGEVVAFAGSSGSGKSTLLGVLLRLRHLYQGTVYLKGRDIATFSREEIAEIFGYVSQDPFLFAGTVAENIAYGSRGNPSDKDIIAAAKKASIHGEILRMLDGYDSLVHENGRNLSGGQRQRIAIARVFLLNPEILLLDEATAGLDMSNELRVQKALEHAMSGRTVISTSHRLSTLKKADRVLFLEDGRITADGTYEDLLAESQRFSSLVCAEFQDIQQDRLGDPRRHSILEQKIPVLLTR